MSEGQPPVTSEAPATAADSLNEAVELLVRHTPESVEEASELMRNAQLDAADIEQQPDGRYTLDGEEVDASQAEFMLGAAKQGLGYYVLDHERRETGYTILRAQGYRQLSADMRAEVQAMRGEAESTGDAFKRFQRDTASRLVLDQEVREHLGIAPDEDPTPEPEEKEPTLAERLETLDNTLGGWHIPSTDDLKNHAEFLSGLKRRRDGTYRSKNGEHVSAELVDSLREKVDPKFHMLNEDEEEAYEVLMAAKSVEDLEKNSEFRLSTLHDAYREYMLDWGIDLGDSSLSDFKLWYSTAKELSDQLKQQEQAKLSQRLRRMLAKDYEVTSVPRPDSTLRPHTPSSRGGRSNHERSTDMAARRRRAASTLGRAAFEPPDVSTLPGHGAGAEPGKDATSRTRSRGDRSRGRDDKRRRSPRK